MTRLDYYIALGALFLGAGPGALFGQGRIVGRFGEANVGGQRVIVHVTVAVPPGLDENQVADEALRGQGARPFQPALLTLTGMVWDQFHNGGSGDDYVIQNYNPAGEPVAAQSSLLASQTTWNNVTTSKFMFSGGGSTSRCPSLVKECPGAQAFDGNNDVGWVPITGCCTLGVTWYSTSIDEADMALNTRFQWTAGGGSGYDLETVFLHENGHALGLGHTPVSGAVMQATYAGVRRSLQTDDRRGVTFLYPETWAVGDISGTVSAAAGGTIAGATVSVGDLPLSTTTNSLGQYTLSGVPAIEFYNVTAGATGYLSQTVTGVGVPATLVNFSLEAGSNCIPRGKGKNCP